MMLLLLFYRREASGSKRRGPSHPGGEETWIRIQLCLELESGFLPRHQAIGSLVLWGSRHRMFSRGVRHGLGEKAGKHPGAKDAGRCAAQPSQASCCKIDCSVVLSLICMCVYPECACACRCRGACVCHSQIYKSKSQNQDSFLLWGER